MPTKPNPPRPRSALLLDGISEPQWKFLRLRAYEDADAKAARSLNISPRTVEMWKKRSERFRALYSMALSQPLLFATGELVWRDAPSTPAKKPRPAENGLLPVGKLYAREQQDAEFAAELRRRELTSAIADHPAPPVDLVVPAPYRKPNVQPRRMGNSERELAAALGVEHCVVMGHWDGKPTLERGKYERAVDVAYQFASGFRIDAWYPDAVLTTSAGLVVVADGSTSRDLRCPVKKKRRCPLVDRRGIDFGACSYWELALGSWLDVELPSEATPSPLCHRDFGIARLLAYVGAATMRPYGKGGGWMAGFPVITARDESERSYWELRVERWNRLILDPWHRVRIVDRGTIINALADWRMEQRIEQRVEQRVQQEIRAEACRSGGPR